MFPGDCARDRTVPSAIRMLRAISRNPMPEAGARIDRIGPALFGGNDRNIVFYETHNNQTNEKKDLLDPWKTPCRFAASSDGYFIIWSAGKDKELDRADPPSGDDWKKEIRPSIQDVDSMPTASTPTR